MIDWKEGITYIKINWPNLTRMKYNINDISVIGETIYTYNWKVLKLWAT